MGYTASGGRHDRTSYYRSPAIRNTYTSMGGSLGAPGGMSIYTMWLSLTWDRDSEVGEHQDHLGVRGRGMVAMSRTCYLRTTAEGYVVVNRQTLQLRHWQAGST